MITLPLESLQASLPEAGWRRLEAYLGQVKVGFDESLVTPFFDGDLNNPKAYGQWYYENIARSGIPELDELEVEEIDKFTPFSIRLPWEERREGVMEYFEGREYPENSTLLQGFDTLKRLIPRGSLRMLEFKASYRAMPKDSNLGLPWFTRDKDFTESYLNRAINLKRNGFRDNLFPAVLGWRGQSSGDPDFPKQRVVWMMDHMETVIGLALQVPLLDKLRINERFSAWNHLSVVDKTVTSFIDSTTTPIMSADYNGFDKTLPEVVIHLVFELFRYWFDKGDWAAIDWLEEQFLTLGIVTPDGIFSDRFKSVPSGSGLTNLVDSLGQLLMIGKLRSSVLGDDGIYLGVADPDELSDFLLTSYGVRVSTDKGGYSRDQVRYLQRLHLRKYRIHGLCVGIRSLVRTWKGACYLERKIPGLHPAFFSARTISQLENAKNHPNFRKAVRYFFERDKLLHQFDPAELFRLAGGIDFVEKTLGLNSFRFGKELPSVGLDSFETVRELRSLRASMNHT